MWYTSSERNLQFQILLGLINYLYVYSNKYAFPDECWRHFDSSFV